MIKQKINGRSVNTVNVSMSSADSATLSGILAGECTDWETVAEGGTPATVAVPNYFAFSVGKKGINGRKSASVKLPHLKVSKDRADVSAAVVGQFDEDFVSTVKCEYMNVFGASSKGA